MKTTYIHAIHKLAGFSLEGIYRPVMHSCPERSLRSLLFCPCFHVSIAEPFLMAEVPVPIPPDVLVAALPVRGRESETLPPPWGFFETCITSKLHPRVFETCMFALDWLVGVAVQQHSFLQQRVTGYPHQECLLKHHCRQNQNSKLFKVKYF